MSSSKHSSRKKIVLNGTAILLVALAMWLVTYKRQSQSSYKSLDVPIKVAMDLSPNGLTVDSLGILTGEQKLLLEMLLPNDSIEIIPYTDRGKALNDIRSGAVHLYATSIPLSVANSLEGIDHTEWVFTSSVSLLYHTENKDWESRFVEGDLPCTVLVAEEDEIATIVVNNLFELAYPNIRLEKSSLSPIQLGILLSKGEIEYLVCDSAIAHSLADADTTLQIADNIGFEINQVWLIAENQEALKAKLDSAIIKTRGNKEWLNILSKKNNFK